ncbi:MAG TPA: hypothetical protein VGD15_11675 [Kribbella sp.]|jgi:hypothetical protein
MIWHVGLAVPDLEQGLTEVGQLFDLTWRPLDSQYVGDPVLPSATATAKRSHS